MPTLLHALLPPFPAHRAIVAARQVSWPYPGGPGTSPRPRRASVRRRVAERLVRLALPVTHVTVLDPHERHHNALIQEDSFQHQAWFRIRTQSTEYG